MDIKEIIIDENYSIREAIKKIDETGKKVLFVEEKGKLKGVISDGDVRRWILKSGDLNDSAKNIINYHPVYITENEIDAAIEIMKEKSITSIPVVNTNKEIVSAVFWNDMKIERKHHGNTLKFPVVIMAGGIGSRLYPYTKILPKPLIPIGDTPIVERIIDKFVNYGSVDFYLTVNYKKNMIKSYFDDLEKAYNVNYVEEEKPLGTGGSLFLLKDKLKDTFFVSNCDILIEADYESIYKYHKEAGNLVTMVCAMKNLTIPYGVIELDSDGKIKQMVEKPEYSFLTNTGMYIVEPEVLKVIPDNKFINFPDIIDMLRNDGKNVGVYPIREKCWMDMGQIEEMEEMCNRIGAN